MEQPVKYWVPSIAPSGMAFYTGKLFPKWNGSLFTGALRGEMLVRLTLNGNAVTAEERLLQNLNERIRDVRQGPDGALWLLTDSSAGRDLAGGAGCEMIETSATVIAGRTSSRPFVKNQKRADGDEEQSRARDSSPAAPSGTTPRSRRTPPA